MTLIFNSGYYLQLGFISGSDGKEYAYNAGGLGLSPGLGRSPGEGNGYPLQFSRLENSMDKGAWQVIVHGVTKSQTQLSQFHTHTTNLYWGFILSPFLVFVLLMEPHFLLMGEACDQSVYCSLLAMGLSLRKALGLIKASEMLWYSLGRKCLLLLSAELDPKGM